MAPRSSKDLRIPVELSISTIQITEDKVEFRSDLEPKKEPEKCTDTEDKHSIGPQLVVAGVICLGFVTCGTTMSFPSVMSATDSLHNIYGQPLVFSKPQLDALGSTTNLGTVLSTLLTPIMVPRFGRKNTMLAMMTLNLFAWGGVTLSFNFETILFFRTLLGIGFGGMMVGTGFTIEVVEARYRPVFTIIQSSAGALGQILGILPALWLPYYYCSLVNCAVPLLFLVTCALLLPQSPGALVLAGKDEAAKKVLTKLRCSESEIKQRISDYKELNRIHKETNFWVSVRSREVICRFFGLMGIFVIQTFSGYTTFVPQYSRIIRDSGIQVNGIVGSMMVQFTQMLGAYASALLVSRLGRKGSLCLSCAAMAGSLVAMATYVYTQGGQEGADALGGQDLQLEASHNLLNITTNSTADPIEGPPSGGSFVPLACLMVTMFASSLGINYIPFVLPSEYFPTAIRPQMEAVCQAVGRSLGVLSLSLYTPLQSALGQAGLLFLYASVCALGLPYSFFCVRETVGRNVG